MKTDSAFRRLLLAALACAALCGAARAENDTRDVDTLVFSGQSLPPVAAEEKALAEVSFAKGAPAVVLLKGEQLEYRLDCSPNNCFHTTFFRRVKLLNAAGVADYSSRKIELPYGEDTKYEGAMARVTLPDGREIDASDNVKYEVTAKGYRLLTISFPGAVPGAILDLQYKMRGLVGEDLEIQERLPVLEARFVTLVPNSTRSFLRVFPLHIPSDHFLSSIPMPAELGAPIPTAGRRVMSFSARNMPPEPDEPNMPPYPDRVARIVVAQTSYAGMSAAQEAYGFFRGKASQLDEWAKIYERRRSHAAKDLAERIAGKEKTALAKIEAIRKELLGRIRVEGTSAYPYNESADNALAAGVGSTADVAMVAMTMLRAVGVKTIPVGFHRRNDGTTLPPSSYLDMTDLMLQVQTEDGPVFWAPGADLPVGAIPFQARELLCVPFTDDKAATPPVFSLPAAQERTILTTTKASLAADGTLEAESTWTFTGEAAAARRATLRARSERQQLQLMQDELREAGAPSALVLGADVPALDDAAPKLKVVVRWRAEGYALVDGKRLLLPPSPLAAIDRSDWAADKRETDVDLGAPRIRTDVVTVALPEGYTTLFPPRMETAGPSGKFEFNASLTAPGQLTIKRTLSVEGSRFPAAQWPTLRAFHLKAAEAERHALIIEPSAP